VTLNDPKAPSDWFKVDGVDALVELALNLHWSWNHAADELWEELDKGLWATTQNPWVILRTVSREKVKAALGTPEFRQKLDSLLRKNRDSYRADAWFQHRHPGAGLTAVAYFSMEFMLSEALPIYSGGLGNVAGDQMKAASELGVPVVGVGLLYRTSTRKAGSRRFIQSTIRGSCPYGRCGSRMASGCDCRFNFPAPGYGFAVGRCQ
jgi:starch phosphorylase